MHTDEYLADNKKLGKKLKKARFVITVVLLVAWYFGFFVDKTFTLNSSTSELDVRELGEVTDEFTAEGEIIIVHEEINVNVPTSTFLGIINTHNEGDSVQFFLSRESRKNQYYTAGYRVLENSKETNFQKVTEIPLKSKSKIKFQYKDGLVIMDINNEGVLQIETGYKTILPFVAAASGQVRYKFSKLDIKYK